jgi:hypothetical protein
MLDQELGPFFPLPCLELNQGTATHPGRFLHIHGRADPLGRWSER